MKLFIILFISLFLMLTSNGKSNGIRFGSILNKKEIIAKTEFNNRRNFFHLFNVHYIICHFAAKGKWPLILPTMQVQVDTVGRSLFNRNDFFIRSFCKKWFPMDQCYRPTYETDFPIVEPLSNPTTIKPTTINTEIEIFNEEPDEGEGEPTTICTCGKIKIPQRPTSQIMPGVYYFDKSHIGNASTETILNTIDFLQSFLPGGESSSLSTSVSATSSAKKKSKNKTKIRINVQPRLDDMDTN